MGNLKIVKRKLNQNDSEHMKEWIAQTENIIYYSKEELLRFNNVWVVEQDSVLSGVGIVNPINDSWLEIKIIIINPNMRRRGIGSLLVKFIFDDLENKNKKILVTSRNSYIIKKFKKLGFTTISFFCLPLSLKFHLLRSWLNIYRIFTFVKKIKTGSMNGWKYLVYNTNSKEDI